MTRWLKLFLFAAILGFAKAHHFVRLVILAGLGLAGLWMLHILAQDYNKIQANGGINIGGDDTKLFKRSIAEGNIHRKNTQEIPQIHWEMVLSRDPASCARSFLCQLAATDEKSLSEEERLMLKMSKNTSQQDSWAGKQLQEALKNGKKLGEPHRCMDIYKYCPYTSQMMMVLLRVFGR